MSQFIQNFIKKNFANGKEIKLDGFNYSHEVKTDAGIVEISVMDGDDTQGTKSLMQVVLVMSNKQEVQMYMALAPSNYSQAETLFKLLELL